MKLKEFNKNNEEGFTLIEIILVIAILGILITLFMPNFGKTQLASRVAAHNANIKMLKSAGAMYLLDNPIDSGNTINMADLKAYLDEDVDLKIDRVISEHINIKEIVITVDDLGGINIKPGEVRVDGDKIVLVEKEKTNE